jgi:hypothetical protein
MHKEGLEALNTAIKINPDLADPYLKKGMYNLSRGNIAEVETNLAEAIRVAPEALNSRLILSSYYMQRNNRAKAFETLKNGLRGNADDVPLYFGMARIRFAEKKRKRGSVCWKKPSGSIRKILIRILPLPRTSP